MSAAASFCYETWFGGTLQKCYKDVKPLHIFDVLSNNRLEMEVLGALELKKKNLPPPSVRLLVTFVIHSGIFSALLSILLALLQSCIFSKQIFML